MATVTGAVPSTRSAESWVSGATNCGTVDAGSCVCTGGGAAAVVLLLLLLELEVLLPLMPLLPDVPVLELVWDPVLLDVVPGGLFPEFPELQLAARDASDVAASAMVHRLCTFIGSLPRHATTDRANSARNGNSRLSEGGCERWMSPRGAEAGSRRRRPGARGEHFKCTANQNCFEVFGSLLS
jgi:hypothetical protein